MNKIFCGMVLIFSLIGAAPLGAQEPASDPYVNEYIRFSLGNWTESDMGTVFRLDVINQGDRSLKQAHLVVWCMDEYHDVRKIELGPNTRKTWEFRSMAIPFDCAMEQLQYRVEHVEYGQ